MADEIRNGDSKMRVVRLLGHRDDIVRDRGGYLVTGPDLLMNGKAPAAWPLERAPYYLETAVPGSFAAGDVRHRSIKRVATAAGEGAMAIAFVHRYLEETAMIPRTSNRISGAAGLS
jgi:thioredoxin reductase